MTRRGGSSGGRDIGPGSGPNNHNTHSLGDENENNIYWKSPEAKKLFGFFDIYYGDVDVVEGLHKRIKFLKQVHQCEYGYQLVIQMTKYDSLNLSSHNKFTIRNQSIFILKAYECVLKELRVGVKWVDCCEKAVSECHNMGIETTKNGRRVADWKHNFRKANKFHHPNSHVSMGKKRTPPLFDLFPQLKARVCGSLPNTWTVLQLRCSVVSS